MLQITGINRLNIRSVLNVMRTSTVLQGKFSMDSETSQECVNTSERNLINLECKYPDFVPNPTIERRNYLREKLERNDMLKRRSVISIPNFYVGSIVAVTSSNPYSPKRSVRFLGICIYRYNDGLRSTFILRNVIDEQPVEVKYALYSPTIMDIAVIKLERRLDDTLFYLRDAPLEYSTFPMDMEITYQLDDRVPVNTLKVPILENRRWEERYERTNYEGIILPKIPEKKLKKAKELAQPWLKYDLMDQYRKSIPQEEQEKIFQEVEEELRVLEQKLTQSEKKKQFIRPVKQNLF